MVTIRPTEGSPAIDVTDRCSEDQRFRAGAISRRTRAVRWFWRSKEYLVIVVLAMGLGMAVKRNRAVSKGTLAYLSSDYAEELTVNCVAKQRCSGPSAVSISISKILLTCDGQTTEVTDADIEGCTNPNRRLTTQKKSVAI
jgi:hypothetical protein